MTADDLSSSHRPDTTSEAIAHCAAYGQRLARAADVERDLRWHVAAFYVGDLSALASPRLRSA
jgi:hypothetical protein